MDKQLKHIDCVIQGSALEKQIIVLLHDFSRTALLIYGRELPPLITDTILKNAELDQICVRTPNNFKRGAMKKMLMSKSPSVKKTSVCELQELQTIKVIKRIKEEYSQAFIDINSVAPDLSMTGVD